MAGAAVLDASAVLALLLDEPGSAVVEPYVGAGLLSVVNFSEVVARLADSGVEQALIESQIAELSLTMVEFDEEVAVAAGLLRPITRDLGLSFADRACLATAMKLDAPVVTADHAWERLQIGVAIELIR